PITQFIQSLCQSMSKASLAHRETQGIQGFLVHDAVTLAYLFYPEPCSFIALELMWKRLVNSPEAEH
ncbi:MAG: hypothetical protein HC825_12230, partial [Oscillatoriales cyanobacterium RM1_1_9]|nr:hypothetical protein [Oscillatoriales cyanobacterium RM1_1_9]